MCCNEDPMQQPSQKKTLSRKNTAYRIQNIFANHVSGKALVSRIYVLCLVAQSCPTLWGPMDWSGLPRPPPGDLPNPGTEPRSPTLQVDSLPAEPPGKPKNTGVSSLSFLQGIFLTQESNWGLRHCRQILHQLSYQGSHPEFIQNS